MVKVEKVASVAKYFYYSSICVWILLAVSAIVGYQRFDFVLGVLAIIFYVEYTYWRTKI